MAHQERGGRGAHTNRSGSGGFRDLQTRRMRREKQGAALAESVSWCVDHEKGARAAIHEGLCDASQEATLNRRLHDAKSNRVTQPVDLIDQRSVLLPSEEDELVVFCCIRGQQGVSVTHGELSRAVITLLRLREHHNTTATEAGKKVFPLTTAAKKALDHGSVSAHWHAGFRSRHSGELRCD